MEVLHHNIAPGMRPQFRKVAAALAALTPYDYCSIMHYPPTLGGLVRAGVRQESSAILIFTHLLRLFANTSNLKSFINI